jgi:hypothetical protein
VSKNPGKQEKQASKNQGKQGWAHWEYAPEEWALLDRIDWGRVVQRYWLTSVLGILGFLLAVALLIWFAVIAPNIGSFGVIMIVPLIILLLYAVVPGTAYRKAKKRHQARQNPSQPQKVTLSGQGIWEAGTHFPFAGSGVEARELNVKLREVRLTSEPTTLHFRIEYLIRNNANTLNKTEINRETIHLLVPRGHESEAEHVAQRFRTEVIEARELAAKRIHDSIVNPPEPS